jgi:hypothetical protein
MEAFRGVGSGRVGQLGCIREGASADLVVVDGDPAFRCFSLSESAEPACGYGRRPLLQAHDLTDTPRSCAEKQGLLPGADAKSLQPHRAHNGH